MLSSLAQAVAYDKIIGGYLISESMAEEKCSRIEEVITEIFNIYPNHEGIIRMVLSCKTESDILGLKDRYPAQVGVPIKPMLSKSIKGISEIMERFKNVRFTSEYKYDGMRG
jgi:DNA ligase-1